MVQASSTRQSSVPTPMTVGTDLRDKQQPSPPELSYPKLEGKSLDIMSVGSARRLKEIKVREEDICVEGLIWS